MSWLFNLKKAKSKSLRWSIRHSAYDFKLFPPVAVLKDNRLNFTANEVNKLIEKRKVRHLTTPFRSHSNGKTESMNGRILMALTAAQIENEKLKWTN